MEPNTFKPITSPEIIKYIDKMVKSSEFVLKQIEKRQKMNITLKKMMDEVYSDEWEDVDLRNKQYASKELAENTYYHVVNTKAEEVTTKH